MSLLRLVPAILCASVACDRPPEPPEEVPGCGDTVLYAVPDDPGARGPWAVGARTVGVGALTVEVFYPAAWGSEADVEPVTYDVRELLPPTQRRAIPDADNPLQRCDCYRDLPLDTERGPYPVVVFIHGTAGWRTQSLTQATHWASRGFVVVAADHPGLFLGDLLSLTCPDEPTGEQDLPRDVDAVLAALRSGDVGFLTGAIDLSRIAVSGHSAGGFAAAEVADRDGVLLTLPMASSTAVTTPVPRAVFLGALLDDVVEYEDTVAAFEASAGARSLVGIDGTGHLAFSDICGFTNDAGDDILTIAQTHGICGTEFAATLFDCDPAYLAPELAVEIVNHATAAALEEVLHCAPPRLEGLPAAHPEVTDLRVEP